MIELWLWIMSCRTNNEKIKRISQVIEDNIKEMSEECSTIENGLRWDGQRNR